MSLSAEELFFRRVRELQIQLGMFERHLPMVPTEDLDDVRQELEDLTLKLHKLQTQVLMVQPTVEPQWRS